MQAKQTPHDTYFGWKIIDQATRAEPGRGYWLAYTDGGFTSVLAYSREELIWQIHQTELGLDRQ